MKSTLRSLILLILVIAFFSPANAQKAIYTTRGGISLGFGVGGAYQQSDIARSLGTAFDFTLGSQLYKREGAFFSADWKFRYLKGENIAYDPRINTDGSYSNLDYKFSSYDLELGLTLNRLREKTRIVVSGFAGAGITHGRSFTDLYDANNNLYNFGSIDPNRDSKLIYKDLVNLSDKDFETSLINKAALLPTAGIYIGYQFSPSFSIGIEHKTNFSLSENNSSTGINMDNRIVSGSRLDMNHYTAIGFIWKIGKMGGSGSSAGTGNNFGYSGTTNPVTTISPTQTNTNPVSVNTAAKIPPTVKITDPPTNPFRTNSGFLSLKASVENADDGISLYQDGNSKSNYIYNSYTHELSSTINLSEGENNIRILAKNSAGSAEDRITIVLEKTVSEIPAPSAEFTSPSGSRINSENENLVITARITNVSNRNDISLSQNGRNISFDFQPGNGVLTASVFLAAGNNTFQLSAGNTAGTARDEMLVIYNRMVQTPMPSPPPSISFINPRFPTTVQDYTFPLRAQLVNVRSWNDIILSMNGTRISNFNFTSSGELSVGLNLREGQNNIELTASNESGARTERTSITYNRPVVIPPPAISFINPPGAITVQDNNFPLRARISNVNSLNNISLSLNGLQISSFNFSNSGELSVNLNLRNGMNNIEISASNESGTRTERTSITYSQPVVIPPPSITFINPAGTVTVQNITFPLSAQVNNVGSRGDVSLTINGLKITNFNFSNSGELSANLNLKEGLNNIEVSGTNMSGTRSGRTSIIYNIPVVIPPPVITFINPPTATSVQYNIFPLRAKTINVESRNSIVLSFNGTRISNFNFSSDGELSSSLNLREGLNNIEITGTNESGTRTEKTTITYVKPEVVQPPVITILMPASSPVNTYNPSGEIRASISNVKSLSDINLSLNGIANNTFSYTISTGELSFKFSLKNGQNTISITAQNSAGRDAKTQIINLEQKPCPLPEIKLSVPGGDLGSTDNQNYVLSAQYLNVNDSRQISMTQNGNPVRPEIRGTQLSFTASLNKGLNTFEIIAKTECGEERKSARINYQPAPVPEPCIPPTVDISLTPLSGADATHELKGTVSNVKNKTDIVVTVNGKISQDFQFVPATGQLTAKYKFTPGTSNVVVSVKNECGNDSKTVSVNMAEPCIPPTVDISLTPLSGADATHELKGTISNVKNKTDIVVTVNGNASQDFQFVPATGQLTAKYKFTPGTSMVVVSVKNECGNDSKTVSVNMAEPCIPPTVDISLTPLSGADATHELKGTISNVKNKTDIVVTVNGNASQDFQFVPATGQLTAKYKFTPGTSMVVVSVKNECGNDSKTVSVNMAEPCIPPTVDISLTPLSGADATHELKGTISNVKNKTDIVVTVNGNASQDFQFVPATGQLTAKYKFTPGTSMVVVSVKNECGSDSKTVSVNMAEPCIPPTVDISLTPLSGADATHELKGTISNVKNKTDIVVTVNGNASQDFQFVPATGQLTAKYKFTPGTSMVVVSVKNECGSDSKTVSVNLAEPCIPPKVDFSLTAKSGDEYAYELKGSASDITNTADIILSVNGKASEDFRFNPGSGEINAAVILTPGSNSVEIRVKNKCGEDSKSSSVSIAEKTCGTRINPGNSAWQFCMVTDRGSFTRDDLQDANFSYTGSASSLFIMPTGGGGYALVNGKAYNLKSGQYYLFTGRLKVSVSSKNPGSMGQWTVCVESDREPQMGNGNSRPASPCEIKETDKENDKGDKDDKVKEGGKSDKDN
ncbi:MAG: hypothetical protein H6538_03580 [Bacteroidales bacterium]|nr:hypothetical protein [Bacteroidales bacterium]